MSLSLAIVAMDLFICILCLRICHGPIRSDRIDLIFSTAAWSFKKLYGGPENTYLHPRTAFCSPRVLQVCLQRRQPQGVPLGRGINPSLVRSFRRRYEPSLFLNFLKTVGIPPQPSKPLLQRGGAIKVDIKMLQLDKHRRKDIEECYAANSNFHQLFSEDLSSRQSATDLLKEQELVLRDLADLGNGWNIRWSTHRGTGAKRFVCILLQCQCGTSTEALKEKYNKKRDALDLDTRCLAHLDVMYRESDYMVRRLIGILQHNDMCLKQDMQQPPAVPLHKHVWQVTLQQLHDGTT
ncbi:hypothetical protein K439DRAFT_1612430 [Ramaria rubella]|nr:hypothetical protein K439DRAFT_1612430 [Ramaria rubella]